MRHIETVCVLIRAERLIDCPLHELAMSRMLRLFAATGPHKYARSDRIYLQMIQELPERFPWLNQQLLMKGVQSVRRSDWPRVGVLTDLAIGQLLMRALKSRGDLTRGRGFTETVRLTWLCTIHRCSVVHQAMCNLTGRHHQTSEQRVWMRRARVW